MCGNIPGSVGMAGLCAQPHTGLWGQSLLSGDTVVPWGQSQLHGDTPSSAGMAQLPGPAMGAASVPVSLLCPGVPGQDCGTGAWGHSVPVPAGIWGHTKAQSASRGSTTPWGRKSQCSLIHLCPLCPRLTGTCVRRVPRAAPRDGPEPLQPPKAHPDPQKPAQDREGGFSPGPRL